ncbi:T9SS type A sorting domain-containing protein [Cytophaga sp. FL35]|uniref:T9SS type A sorting domain-containing protein n=1 Tax=Cytophaga sp. FL35 TaxID=1904456 RepID=UPI0016537B3F|nr:T9SS type A sorting domain-containing protein [Cytophaga sp. FL35]MBC6997706.1 T9SS type A sorting domain-containing protein [Cytophaga sp. FL35]
MKNLLSFLVLYCTLGGIFQSFGQSNDSEYGILFLTDVPSGSPSSGTINVIHSQGSFLYKPTSTNREEYNYYELPSNFSGITVRYSAFGVDDGCSNDEEITFTPEDFNRSSYGFFGCIGQISTYPIHLPSPDVENSRICPEDEIFLSYGWHWQYQIIKEGNVQSEWEYFPPEYQEKRSLTLKLEDFLTNSELDKIQQIKFQTGYDDNFLKHITYEVTKCSPTLLTDPPIAVDETCVNSNNGSFSATFERGVVSGEKMMVKVTNTVTSQPYQEEFYENDFTSGTINWPKTLPPGTYFLEWVTLTDNGDDTFPDKARKSTNNFTINEAIPLVFDSLNKTDETCQGEANGIIENIQASGGKPPYQYAIENQFDFSSENFFDKLPAGTYNVLIRDSNDCTTNQEVEIISGEPLPTFYFTANSTSFAQNGNGVIEIALEDGSNTNGYSYVWTSDDPTFTTQNSPTLQNLNTGTYSLIVTETATGCKSNQVDNSFTISTIPELSVSLTANNEVHCPGDTSALSASVTYGTGSGHTYEWFEGPVDTGISIPGNTNTITVEAGSYSVRVTDDGGNTATSSFDLNYTDVNTGNPINEILAATVAIQEDAKCKGESSGRISLDITGGTGSYQVFWDGSLTAGPIDNSQLGAGPHTYRIDDGNCTITGGPIVIGEPSEELTITFVSKTDVNANGGSDGSIEIALSGTTPDYTIEWLKDGIAYTPTSGSTNTRLIGLEVGSYSAVVTNNNGTGCSSTLAEAIIIGEPGPLTIENPQAIVEAILCFGDNTGRITAQYSGTAPFEFVWFDENGIEIKRGNEDFIENLVAGTYSYTIDDASATPPITSDAINVGQPSEIISFDITATGTCANSTEGSILISNAQGGTPGYAYSIDGTNFKPSGNFSFLNSGNYTVTVRDSNGCEMVQTDVVVDSYPEILLDNENTIVLSVSAEGRRDGAISPIFTGGVPPFTYQWTGPNVNGTNTQDISGLAEGDYSILVTDANGCVLNESFIITEPGELIVTASQTEVIPCSGDAFGEIAGQVTGGVAPYILEWFQQINGSDIRLAEDSNLLADLGPGSYFLRATDANGINADSGIVLITEPDLLTASVLSTTSILCSGEATGAVEVTFSGGTAPYEFSWSNGDSSLNLTNVPSGEYTLFISDVNGCYTELTAVVEAAPDALQISNRDLLNVSEYNANDGSISLELSGGAFPFDIEWTQLSNGLAIGDQENISRLAAGRYQVTISDDNGCRLTEIFEITQPDIVEETIIQPACEGDTDGSISLLVNQGNGTFTYEWSTGETTNTITNLAPGSYSVTVIGLENGPVTRTYLIEYPKPVEVDLGEDQTLCLDQELALDASIEDEGAIYSWTSNNGFTSNSPAINITQSGTYMVTVTSSSGCKAEGSISVNVSTEEINAELAASTQAFVNETIIAVDISYPLPDRLEWIFPDEALVVSSDSDEAQLQFTEAGEYEIGIITYRGDCIAQQTKKIIINQSDSTVKEEATANGSKLVEDFLIYPNPSSGQFTADVHMTERGNISIKVFSLANNALIASKKERGASSYEVPFDISGLPAGVYAVLLETPYGKTLRKVIKK